MNVKIYYHDTDAAGVVYYANYLRYTEMARSEYLLSLGMDIHEHHNEGFYFAVVHAEISYKQSARLGDTIQVTTEVGELRGASLTMSHEIFRGDTLLATAEVRLAHINSKSRPCKLPPQMLAAYKKTLVK